MFLRPLAFQFFHDVPRDALGELVVEEGEARIAIGRVGNAGDDARIEHADGKTAGAEILPPQHSCRYPSKRNDWTIRVAEIGRESGVLSATFPIKVDFVCAAGSHEDDASLVEASGHPVAVAEGAYENIKVTTQEDLLLAEKILEKNGSFR